MATNFHQAHLRHLDDAKHLEQHQRLANADHLLGFAAECGLKALMVVFGMPVEADGSPSRAKDRRHINRLVHRYTTYQQGPDAAQYALTSAIDFSNWDVSDRYAGDGHVSGARAASHRQGADEVHALVRQAEMEGLLP